MSIYFNPEDNLFYDSEIDNFKILESFIEITGGKEEYYTYLKLLSERNTIVVNEFGEITFTPEIFETPSIFTQILNFKEFVVDSILNDTARVYGYDSIDNAISYYNSSVTAWAEEAAAFNTWRDNTLSLMYQNIFSFTADGVTLPDLDGFTGQTGYAQLTLGEPSRPQLLFL